MSSAVLHQTVSVNPLDAFGAVTTAFSSMLQSLGDEIRQHRLKSMCKRLDQITVIYDMANKSLLAYDPDKEHHFFSVEEELTCKESAENFNNIIKSLLHNPSIPNNIKNRLIEFKAAYNALYESLVDKVFMADDWDIQMYHDAESGKLDELFADDVAEFKRGQCQAL